MIYFVVAQKEDDGKWEVFGPWDYIEGADNKIAKITFDPQYSQVELARVLTDEDDSDEWRNYNHCLSFNDDGSVTRERCKVCNSVNTVGFSVPDKIWLQVVPKHLQNSVLCIACFTAMGDLVRVQWDKNIKFYPVSLVTHDSADIDDKKL